MLTIDVEHLLDEKRSKELIYSLNELIRTVIKRYTDKINGDKDKHGRYRLELKFDNGNTFYISALFTPKEIKTDYGYITQFEGYKDCLSLQEALNINKYALNIEFRLNQFLNQPRATIEAYYTEQNIGARLPIFNEDDTRARFIKPGTEPCEYVIPTNIFVPTRIRDDDFER